MSTYQGCLYCKYYCVCRLTKDVCIVSITVYVDLPRLFVLSVLLCMQTYQGCLYCKYYCVCRLPTDCKYCCVVYQGCLYCKYYCVCRLTKDVYYCMSITVYYMQTYQGCLYCKYYCVCRLTKVLLCLYQGNCIVPRVFVSITVYVDLPRMFVL